MRARYLFAAAATLAAGLGTLLYPGPGRAFVRGSLGDVAAVAFISFCLGAAWPRVGLRVRLALTGAIAVVLELAQLAPGAVRESPVLSFILGAHFDPWDFAWYAVGLGIAGVVGASVERTAVTR